MIAKFSGAAALTLALSLVTSAAKAGADDYAFDPVAPEMKKGDDVTVAVRLTDKRTGKPVPDAVIFKTRVDMAPDGMAEMEVGRLAAAVEGARRIRLQDRYADGRTLPDHAVRKGPGRTRDRQRQGHREGDQVSLGALPEGAPAFRNPVSCARPRLRACGGHHEYAALTYDTRASDPDWAWAATWPLKDPPGPSVP